jgi:hypothetical protein
LLQSSATQKRRVLPEQKYSTRERTINRAVVPHSVGFFNTRFAGGCRAPIFRVRRMLSLHPRRASADAEISSSPDCLGLPSPPNRPTGHDNVTMFLYPVKGRCSLSCSLGQDDDGRVSESLGKPQAVGGGTPPTTPSKPLWSAVFRAPHPPPLAKRVQRRPPTRRVYVSMAPGRVSS